MLRREVSERGCAERSRGEVARKKVGGDLSWRRLKFLAISGKSKILGKSNLDIFVGTLNILVFLKILQKYKFLEPS